MGRWGLGGKGTEQKGKRTHGHGQQCGDCWGVGGIREVNGNGKNTIKIKLVFKLNNSFEALAEVHE